MDVRPRIKSVEGRSRVAVAHLAVARSQNTRTGILGYIRKTAMMAVFFVVGSVCDEIIREDARKVLFMWKKYWKIGLIFVCLSFICVMGMIEPYIPDDREITVTNTYEEYGQEYFETAFVEESSEEEEVPFVLTRNPHIRVVLKTSDYGGIFHRNVLLSCGEEYDLLNKEGVLYASYKAGTTTNFSDFNMQTGDVLVVKSRGAEKFSLDSLTRAVGVPFYRGELWIYKEDEGYVVVNELPLEEYLLTVVPSEMPSSYPADALAAQAVCARSYAYFYLDQPAYPEYEAHLDDSTSFQVYNNIEETEATTLAVAQTSGWVLLNQGKPTTTFFFSTSCGVTANENVWKMGKGGSEVLFEPVVVAHAEESAVEAMALENDLSRFAPERLQEEAVFTQFIMEKDSSSLEAGEQWYRWTYSGKLHADTLYDKICSVYEEKSAAVEILEKNTFISKKPKEFSHIRRIYVESRLPGGVADTLIIETNQQTLRIKSEYYIRKVLADESGKIVRNDGSKTDATSLLPSGYFVLETTVNKKGNVSGIKLWGGGYGHGVGMSQNGAKCAANAGMEWKEILSFFYDNLELTEAE